MKVLIVYDTVSPMKLTAKVAETIGKVLKDKGILVDLFYNKVIVNLDFTGAKLKSEMNKLLNLSKNEISILNINFD